MNGLISDLFTFIHLVMLILITHILMCPVLITPTTKIMVNYIYYDVKGVYSHNNVLKILSILFVVSKREDGFTFLFT